LVDVYVKNKILFVEVKREIIYKFQFFYIDIIYDKVYTLSYMKTAVLNIKIDPKVKKDAQKVADELGFTLSAIINASLKNLARSKTVSFSLLEPTPFLAKAIRSADADYAKGKKTVGPFRDAESMMKSLRQ